MRKQETEYTNAIREAIKDMEALFDNMGPSGDPMSRTGGVSIQRPLVIKYTAADIAFLASVGMKP